MKTHSLLRTILLVILILTGFPAWAQWVTQQIDLQQGWNAVFLEVEPYPPDCALQFEGMPIESVWTPNRQFQSVQFIQDPDELIPEAPDWHSFFPPDSPKSVATNLHLLEGGRAYMVYSASAVSWLVKGQPKLAEQKWNPKNYNFVGFYVDPQSPPTFGEWFADSSAQQPLDVWQFGADQRWHPISNAGATLIQSGVSYWVYCNDASDFQGPVRIDLLGATRIDFLSMTAEGEITVESAAAGKRDVTLNLQASEPPPTPLSELPQIEIPPLAGSVVLVYQGFGITGPVLEFLDFPMTLSLSRTEGLTKRLELAVDRKRMAPASPEGLYQSILEVTDGAGFRRYIGVTSEGRVSRSKARLRRMKGLQDAPAEAGLWIGTVSINRVSEPNVLSVSPTELLLTATRAEFDFRVILHVDAQGVVRFLNEVTQMVRRETTQPNPDNPDELIPDKPGRAVLMTANPPQALLDDIAGGAVVPNALRDGRRFASRISTAMFSLRDASGEVQTPVMGSTGSFYDDGTVLTLSLVLEDTDPLNPFHHAYHPMHSYPETGQPPLPSMDYTITRDLVFNFSHDPPDGFEPAGWLNLVVGGTYTETMTGLRKVNATTPPVVTQGTFTLNRISEIEVLNDGL